MNNEATQLIDQVRESSLTYAEEYADYLEAEYFAGNTEPLNYFGFLDTIEEKRKYYGLNLITI